MIITNVVIATEWNSPTITNFPIVGWASDQKYKVDVIDSVVNWTMKDMLNVNLN